MTVDAIGYVKAREYIEANYEWDKSGRGYIRKSDNQLMLIPMVMSDYVADLQRQLEEAQTELRRERHINFHEECKEVKAQLAAMREALSLTLGYMKHLIGCSSEVTGQCDCGAVPEKKAARELLANPSTEQWQRERDAKVLRKMGAFFEERAKNLTTQQPDYALKFANMHYIVDASIDPYYGEVHLTWHHGAKQVVLMCFPNREPMVHHHRRVLGLPSEHGIETASPDALAHWLRWLHE